MSGAGILTASSGLRDSMQHMDRHANIPINFDELRLLAAKDPAAFERRRAELIHQFIEHQSPERRQRLERLQWRIDMERRKYRHPLVSAQRLYAMMWDSVTSEHGLLAALGRLAQTHTANCDDAASKANVVPFRSASG